MKNMIHNNISVHITTCRKCPCAVEWYNYSPLQSVNVNWCWNIGITITYWIAQNHIVDRYGCLLVICTSGSRGGGAHPAPPLTAADLCFFMPKMLIFLNCFLRSRLILSIIFIETWPKTRKIMTFTSTINTFNDFLPLHPPPWQSPPPHKVKSVIFILFAKIWPKTCLNSFCGLLKVP